MHKSYLLITAFLLFLPLVAQSADVQSKEEGKKEESMPVVKDEALIMRQKNFLHRVIDDVDKSISYMVEDIENFESRIDSIVLLEPEERDNDLSSIKGSYESHLKWLVKMKEAFELDYESYFIDGVSKRDWIKRCTVMVENYESFQIKAIKGLANYEKKRERLVYYLNRQRFLMVETQSLRNEIAALERKRDLLPTEESRLKSLRNKLWAYQVEMNALVSYKEEMYLHYLLLVEQLRDKRDWLSIKIEEYKVLSSLAMELDSGTVDAFRLKYKELIGVYEKEIALLKRKIDVTGNKDWSVTPYGEIREIERFEELTDYYKLMKSRYGDYKGLLGVQADGFRADMEMKRSRN